MRTRADFLSLAIALSALIGSFGVAHAQCPTSACRFDSSRGTCVADSGCMCPNGQMCVLVPPNHCECAARECVCQFNAATNGCVGPCAIGKTCVLVAANQCQCTAPSAQCDLAIRDTITDPTQTKRFSFNVGASLNEQVSITVVNDAPTGPNFQAYWRLIDGAGNPTGPYPCYRIDVGKGPNTVCGPLAATGNPYRIEVGDAGADDTGAFRLHLQRLTAAAGCEDHPQCIIADTPLSSPPAVDTDLFSFNVIDGQSVSITVINKPPTGPNFQAYWRLINGAGNPTGPYPCGRIDVGKGPNTVCGPLAATGNPYRVEVGDAGADDTGNYDVSVNGTPQCP